MAAMVRIRLLEQTPEGGPGNEVVVASHRANDLVSIGQAERVVDRVLVVERTDAAPVVVVERTDVTPRGGKRR